MQPISQSRFAAGLILLGAAILFHSCLRKNFDAPPDNTNYDPGLTVTHTIAQLKAMNGPYISTTNYPTTLITADVIVEGVVTADDRTGNFYKQIVIQDATGGISINVDAYSLYNHYPVGRKLYIKCKDLHLGYDGGTPQLGKGIDPQKQVKGLESTDIDAHIIRADMGHVVQDTVITLAQARAADPFFYNRLVTVKDVEFSDTTKQYTDSGATTNRYLVNCAVASTTITLTTRNSNYSSFHTLFVPTGHGSVSGIFTVYQTSASSKTGQILLRDTSDVKCYEPRCGSGSGSSGKGALISIDSMRRRYPGSGTLTLGSYKITGIVISDIDNKNIPSGNMIIEDNSRKGVIVYISGSTAYKLGDSVTVDLTGATLKLYNGALEIEGVTAAKILKSASGKTVDPVTLTIAQLNAGFAEYESILVKILNGKITGPNYGAATTTLDDGSGSIQLYTAATALFAGQVPPATVKTVVGIPTPYNTTKELKVRNPAIDIY